MKRHATTIVLALLVAALAGLLAWQLAQRKTRPPVAAVPSPGPPPAELRPVSYSRTAPEETRLSERLSRLAEILAALAHDDARDGEAVLSFANEAAYRRFLEHAAEYGLRILGRLDGLLSVRLGYELPTDLDAALADLGESDVEVAANFLLFVPGVPALDPRTAAGTIPLGNRLREFLGITEDSNQWGSGITIAVIDTGVAADRTFDRGRLRALDLGFGLTGTGASDGHATAVAALAAGALPDAQGVAPGATLLSLRVTDESGLADVFSVAQAIIAATDNGAQIVNISLGGYHNSAALTRAIDYATSRGVVLVASAGNDQAAQLTWPAADPRVVSVGAVDAAETQVLFSNSGSQLQLTAPGYGVQTAWSDGTRVMFDGTSASAPIAAGAIAAVMTQYPGMTAAQAVEILRQYSSDGGAPGTDSAYGSGIVNLGWALAYNDPARVDTAVSSHHYDAATDTVDFVIQNRSARGIGNLTLAITATAGRSEVRVPWLDAGASMVISVPADGAAEPGAAGASFRTELVNPPGTIDAAPANNIRSSRLQPPTENDG